LVAGVVAGEDTSEVLLLLLLDDSAGLRLLAAELKLLTPNSFENEWEVAEFGVETLLSAGVRS
jgi:hypothetical protein